MKSKIKLILKMIYVLIPRIIRQQVLDDPIYLYKEILTQGMGINAMKFTDEEAVKTLCEKVRDLSEAVGITQTVKDVGAKKKDFAMLADKAMEDPCKPGNPREVTKQDFIDLYEKAW